MRIMVLGLSCSGKSTFSNHLHQITKIPIYHLDSFYWKYPWKRNESFSISSLLINDAWIMDGNYFDYNFKTRLALSDYVFYIDSSLLMRIYRMIKRHIHYKRNSTNKNAVSNMINLNFIFSTIKKQIFLQPRILKLLNKNYKNKLIYIKNIKELKRIMQELKNEKCFFEFLDTHTSGPN